MATTNHPQVTAALRGLAEARPAYVEAEQFFEGVADEVFYTEKLRKLFAKSGQKLRINYARTPVDVLLENTTIQGWTVKDAAQAKAIAQAWDDNELGIEAKDVHRRAYEYGDAYLIGWPAHEDDASVFPGGVEVYAHDPKRVRVFYDPAQPRRKRLAVHTWEEAGDEENGLGPGIWQRVNLYYPDVVEEWVSKVALVDASGLRRAATDEDEFEEYGDEGAAWPLDNPTPGIIPVFHFRTGRPYGRPEHADAYGPQNGINKLVTSLFGVVDRQILPQRWALEDDTTKANAGIPTARPDALFDDEDVPLTERQTAPATGQHDLGTEPGDVWLMRGTKSVGQFDPADPKNLIDPMLALVQAMADVTDMPANRYHRGGQAPSADSQRMDEVPLRNKIKDRHANLGVTWHEFAEWVCLVNNLGATDAQVAWASPESHNDKASWEAALLQLDVGIPFAQVLRERGYSEDVIAKWEGELPDGVPPSQAVPPAPVIVEAPPREDEADADGGRGLPEGE